MSAQWGTWARNLSLEVSEWLNISQKVMQTWSHEWTLYMLSQSLIKAHLSKVHQVYWSSSIRSLSILPFVFLSYPLSSDKCAFIRDWEGVWNIGINVGYKKTDFLALVYSCNFRPFWGSNVLFSAPTLQNVVQCTLFGPIPKFSGPLGPNVPKSDLKHSITHFFSI